MLALREDENSLVWSTDVAVPISRLPEMIGEFLPYPSCT